MDTLNLKFLLIMVPLLVARDIDIKADCSSEPDGTYLPDLASCSYFYICLKGHPYRIRCPQGQYFDETLDMCSSAYLVHRHRRHRLNDKRVENNSSKEDCNHYTTTSPTCTQENNVSSITTPSDTFSSTECETDSSTTTPPKTLITTECETDESSTETQKPSSTTEDKPESPTVKPPQSAGSTEGEIDSSNTSPSDSSTTQPTHKPTTTPKPRSCNDKGHTLTFFNILRKSVNISVSDEIKAKCNALPDGAFVGDPIDCAKYYVCLNKEPIEHCCEPGRGFDTDKFVCNFKELIKNCQVS